MYKVTILLTLLAAVALAEPATNWRRVGSQDGFHHMIGRLLDHHRRIQNVYGGGWLADEDMLDGDTTRRRIVVERVGAVDTSVQDDDDDMDCTRCPPGYGVRRQCIPGAEDTVCGKCGSDEFTPALPHMDKCKPCPKCGPSMYEFAQCTSTSPTECGACDALSPNINDDFMAKCPSKRASKKSPEKSTDDAWNSALMMTSGEMRADLSSSRSDEIITSDTDENLSDEKLPMEPVVVDTFPSEEVVAEREHDEAVMKIILDDIERNEKTVDHEEETMTQDEKNEGKKPLWRLGPMIVTSRDEPFGEEAPEKVVDSVVYMPQYHDYDLKAVLRHHLYSARLLQTVLVIISGLFAVMIIVLVARRRCDSRRTSGVRVETVRPARSQFGYAKLTDEDLNAIRTCASRKDSTDGALWVHKQRTPSNNEAGFDNPLAEYFESTGKNSVAKV